MCSLAPPSHTIHHVNTPPFGTHHSKFFFLFYRSSCLPAKTTSKPLCGLLNDAHRLLTRTPSCSLRVVIHTANLIAADWTHKSQGVWCAAMHALACEFVHAFIFTIVSIASCRRVDVALEILLTLRLRSSLEKHSSFFSGFRTFLLNPLHPPQPATLRPACCSISKHIISTARHVQLQS
jgi:hypothetical protein